MVVELLAELVRVDYALGPTAVFGDLNARDESDEALGVLTSLGGLASMPPHPTDGAEWV